MSSYGTDTSVCMVVASSVHHGSYSQLKRRSFVVVHMQAPLQDSSATPDVIAAAKNRSDHHSTPLPVASYHGPFQIRVSSLMWEFSKIRGPNIDPK